MVLNSAKVVLNKTTLSIFITLIICFVASSFYTSKLNKTWTSQLIEKQQKIDELEKKHNDLQNQISNLTGELKAAKESTKKAEDKAKQLQKKVDQLIGDYDNDDDTATSTDYSTPAEEIQALKVQNTKMKADIKIFIAEIKADRELIDLQKKEIELYVRKEDLMKEDINSLNQTVDIQKKVINDQQAKLEDVTKKKDKWKVATVTTGSTLLVTLALLLLL